MANERFYGTGRRKSAVARVWLWPGQGNIQVNGRALEEYFPRETNRAKMLQPVELSELEGRLDMRVNVQGGGHSGQAEAIRHGISRALCHFNGELRTPLKRAGFLTRDARVIERKKYGQPGARKRYQFSKR